MALAANVVAGADVVAFRHCRRPAASLQRAHRHTWWTEPRIPSCPLRCREASSLRREYDAKQVPAEGAAGALEAASATTKTRRR